MKRSGLWTKDFTKITVATAFSIIAGEAMNLPISLLVFDETRSTVYSSLILVLGFLPDLLFSVAVAPMIDRSNKKHWIVAMDIIMAAIYIAMGIITALTEFSFAIYAVFTFLVATDSTIYRLAYDSWYPELIANGCEQKGYSVSTTLYPLITIVIAPVATFLYEFLSISNIFFIVTAVLLAAIFIEGSISHISNYSDGESYSVKKWKADIKAGFNYIKKEKGIRNIYSYMSISFGVGEGINLLTQAFYQTQPFLTVTMLGFLKSAEMIGRLLGGFLQYKFKIPVKKRFFVTVFVYVFYQLADMILLFTPYPAMVVNRFAVGGLGSTSFNIRMTAVNNYMPADMRARVNAFGEVVVSIGSMAFYMLAGVLGQALSYRKAVIIVGSVGMLAILIFIIIPKKHNKPVYEAEKIIEE